MEFLFVLIKIIAACLAIVLGIGLAGLIFVFFSNLLDVFDHAGQRLTKALIKKFDDQFKGGKP